MRRKRGIKGKQKRMRWTISLTRDMNSRIDFSPRDSGRSKLKNMRRSKGLRGRQGMRSGKEVQGGEDGAMRDDEGSMEVEGGREGESHPIPEEGDRRSVHYTVYTRCYAMPCHAMLNYTIP